MSDEQVGVGENVLTSGGDQIFPKGLPVGTVTNVSNGKDLFLNIKIKPATDLSKLEEVLVLVEKQDRQAVAEDSGHRRAADILAERLPSVPDRPPDASSASSGAPRPATNGVSGTAGASKPASATAVPQVAKSSAAAANGRAPGTTPTASGTVLPKLSAAPKTAGTATKAAANSQSPATSKPATIPATVPATRPSIRPTAPSATPAGDGIVLKPAPATQTEAPVQSHAQPAADSSSPQ